MTAIDTFWFASNKSCAVDGDCEWRERVRARELVAHDKHGAVLCVCPWSWVDDDDSTRFGSRPRSGERCGGEKGPNFWYSIVWRTIVLLVYSWLLVYAVRSYLKINTHFN